MEEVLLVSERKQVPGGADLGWVGCKQASNTLHAPSTRCSTPPFGCPQSHVPRILWPVGHQRTWASFPTPAPIPQLLARCLLPPYRHPADGLPLGSFQVAALTTCPHAFTRPQSSAAELAEARVRAAQAEQLAKAAEMTVGDETR